MLLTIVIAAALLAARGRAWCQEPGEVSPFGARYDTIRFLFGLSGAKLAAIADVASIGADEAPNWVVVAMGGAAGVERLGIDLPTFVVHGGTALIASDEDTEAAIGRLGLWTRSAPWMTPPPEFRYEGRDFCPLVSAFDAGDPLFEGVRAVACNLPGAIEGPLAAQSAVAWLPRSLAEPPDARGRGRPLIAHQRFGAGRLLLVADQSIFINEMILEPRENGAVQLGGNLSFARNCVRWALDGRDPSSLNVIFIEEGQEAQRWIDPEFVSGEFPPPDADLLTVINEFLREIQEEHRQTNVLNELLLRGQNSLSLGRVRWWLFIVASAFVALLLAALFCLWARRGPRPDPPMVDLPLALLERRRHEVVATNQFAEPARQLARRLFAPFLIDDPDRTTMPNAIVHGPMWDRWRTGWQLRRIWRIATARSIVSISRRRFLRLQREVAGIEDRVRQGTVAWKERSSGG